MKSESAFCPQIEYVNSSMLGYDETAQANNNNCNWTERQLAEVGQTDAA
jgi:hypothetical protein